MHPHLPFWCSLILFLESDLSGFQCCTWNHFFSVFHSIWLYLHHNARRRSGSWGASHRIFLRHMPYSEYSDSLGHFRPSESLDYSGSQPSASDHLFNHFGNRPRMVVTFNTFSCLFSDDPDAGSSLSFRDSRGPSCPSALSAGCAACRSYCAARIAQWLSAIRLGQQCAVHFQ